MWQCWNIAILLAEEPTSKIINIGKEIETSNIQQTENDTMFKRPKLECKICSKEFNKYAIYAYTHGPVTGSGPSVVWP